jgi:hypothetical protein
MAIVNAVPRLPQRRLSLLTPTSQIPQSQPLHELLIDEILATVKLGLDGAVLALLAQPAGTNPSGFGDDGGGLFHTKSPIL